jgi:hypothetical protein
MGKVVDFKAQYAQKVFAIYPTFLEKGWLGWGIINRNAEHFGGEENVPLIHRSGIIRVFSTASNLINMDTLCEQFISIWRHDSGYSKEPAVLAIEQPDIYPDLPSNFSGLVDLSILVGMLTYVLHPRLTLIPTTLEWRGTKQKSDIKAEIENINDYHSKKALKRDLEMVALQNQHQIYDALGIGIYGVEVDLGLKPMPRLCGRIAP